jgi:oxalate---CoA ligase
MDLISRDDEHPALIASEEEEVLTYRDLRAAIDHIAHSLGGAGIGPGDPVAMVMPNSPEFVVTFLGILGAGAAAAPLNPSYTEPEYVAYLEDIAPKAIVYRSEPALIAHRAAKALRIAELCVERSKGDELALTGPDVPPGDPTVDRDVALLLHTSGTTGKPKGVPLRRSNLAASVKSIANTYQLGYEDVSHCVMPLFHVHGLVASTLATLHTGGTVVVPPRFSASSFWPDSVRFDATWYSAVPTIHQVLAARADEVPRGHSLRFARSCSAPLPPTLQGEIERLLGVPLVQAYGMSEAAHQVASNPLPPFERRPGSVGLATGVEVGVVDGDWHLLGPDAQGEIVIRGDSVIDGYRGAAEANAESFRDGWFRTGDSGWISADGYVTLEGRLKELINRGGEKISPYEVEEALLTHPAVSETVVYALEDPKYGERVAAAVVFGDGSPEASELREHCEERLASFKVPEEIVVVTEIPKGPTGKVQRRAMAQYLHR